MYACDEEERESKAYICLRTCASAHAVHLEVTGKLSATAFLLAFRCSYSQKGIPTVIFSDNARTFKHSKEIKRVIRTEEVQWYLTNQQIIWNFIVERPLVGGVFWERLVKGVKICFKKPLTDQP